MEDGNSLVVMWASFGFGSCIWMLLMFYNLVGLVGFLREDTGGESSSALSKAAWAIGFLSFLLGPCMWFGAVIALILARVERGRIYEEKSSFASSTPCAMGSINAGVTLFMWVIGLMGALSSFVL